MDVQAGLALSLIYWWQRLITFDVGRIRVMTCDGDIGTTFTGDLNLSNWVEEFYIDMINERCFKFKVASSHVI